jgi:hypothetical protein
VSPRQVYGLAACMIVIALVVNAVRYIAIGDHAGTWVDMFIVIQVCCPLWPN